MGKRRLANGPTGKTTDSLKVWANAGVAIAPLPRLVGDAEPLAWVSWCLRFIDHGDGIVLDRDLAVAGGVSEQLAPPVR